MHASGMCCTSNESGIGRFLCSESFMGVVSEAVLQQEERADASDEVHNFSYYDNMYRERQKWKPNQLCEAVSMT